MLSCSLINSKVAVLSQQIKRVCVIGYQGKMGRLAVDFITHQQGYEIAGLVGRQDDVVEVIKNHRPDMVLDLSLHDVVYDHAVRVIQTQTPLVIGASGLDKHQLAQLMALCERLVSSCLVVPNFSISACLMMRFAGLAAPFF